MKRFIATMAMVVLGTTAGFAAQSRPIEAWRTSEYLDPLVTLSRNARSAAEHADVAKQYRQRAESMNTEAAKLDAELNRLTTQRQPQMAGKWPAMYGNRPVHVANLQSEAIAAKQAAHEATLAAERHYQLAVEQGFGTRNAN